MKQQTTSIFIQHRNACKTTMFVRDVTQFVRDATSTKYSDKRCPWQHICSPTNIMKYCTYFTVVVYELQTFNSIIHRQGSIFCIESILGKNYYQTKQLFSAQTNAYYMYTSHFVFTVSAMIKLWNLHVINISKVLNFLIIHSVPTKKTCDHIFDDKFN